MRRDLLTKLYMGLPEMERTPAREIPLSSGVRLLRSRPPHCSTERKSSAGYARLGLRSVLCSLRAGFRSSPAPLRTMNLYNSCA
jgi:hypothetical protein